MIVSYPLSPGATLCCYHDERFKQGCVSIQLVRPASFSETAISALLPSVLLRGTVRHPSIRSITLALDDLYGASVSPLVRRVGDCQTTGLYCGFMDDRFTRSGDKVLEPMIAFLREILTAPAERGGFPESFVESEKKNLISTIECDRNDKQLYAMGRLLKLMGKADSIGLPRLGEPEQVAAITAESLYGYYHKIFAESPIRIFYVGSCPPERVAALTAPLFDLKRSDVLTLPPQTALSPGEGQNVTETMEVAQSSLCMGFVSGITNRSELFPAMQVLNQIFGAGAISKLFTNVREKQSLCYSIGSGYYSTKGIVTVSAGIDGDERDRVQAEVCLQLEKCADGQISSEELHSAKQELLSALRAVHDAPGSIEGYYANAELGGLPALPEEYMEKISAVQRQQAAAAARTLHLHSTYFLTEGGEKA